jgi:hypothetical protein
VPNRPDAAHWLLKQRVRRTMGGLLVAAQDDGSTTHASSNALRPSRRRVAGRLSRGRRADVRASRARTGGKCAPRYSHLDDLTPVIFVATGGAQACYSVGKTAGTPFCPGVGGDLLATPNPLDDRPFQQVEQGVRIVSMGVFHSGISLPGTSARSFRMSGVTTGSGSEARANCASSAPNERTKAVPRIPKVDITTPLPMARRIKDRARIMQRQ